MSPLLEVNGVAKYYRVRKQRVTALHNVNLKIDSDNPKIVALAGESGSGKSTLANLILGFTRPDEGSIVFNGVNIHNKSERALRDYRKDVQAIFQDPFGVFNPFYRVRHVFELLFRNFGRFFPKNERQARVRESLSSVGLQGPEILDKYPHQLSGGQRQRIMMARACLMKPRLIVADEPVSMVDASLRASILDVMMKLRDEQGISFLYITHDLATAYQVCDEILLLYQGRVLEQGEPADVIGAPKHPYAKLLVSSIPGIEYSHDWVNAPVQQSGATAMLPDQGCCFASRCELAEAHCMTESPSLLPYPSRPSARGNRDEQQRAVACHFHELL